MSAQTQPAPSQIRQGHTPSFAELYTPKLLTVLREGYRFADLRADFMSGLTVAIVALPLSMAIAIGSGVTPERGLYTSIVGGFLVSALGGSRLQIGGPAGAFIVLVATTLAQHGLGGLLVAVFLSGLILMAMGLLRLGTFIKYIPYPVTVGFTSGIAVIIFSGEIRDLLGMHLAGKEPGPLIPKLEALFAAASTIDPATVAVSVASIAIMVAVRRFRPHWPAYLIAVAIMSLAAWALHLNVVTIASRFGGIPGSLPTPSLPDLSPSRIIEMLPAGAAFALLGSIESLLSAVVADSMSGRRHRSNAELVAQGIANVASSLFGGICVTGTIARTATNVRAGARGPISGMLHAVFVLLFLVVAAPLAGFIPLAALASVLGVVCWNMAEKQQFAALVRASLGDALVLLVTFLVVIFRDLTEGILVGFVLANFLFLHRMAHEVGVEHVTPVADDDVADSERAGGRQRYDAALASDPGIVAYRLSGAFFFGAAANVGAALERIGERPKAYVIDFSAVSVIDSSAASTMEGFIRKARRQHAEVYISGAQPAIREALQLHGVTPQSVHFLPAFDTAIQAARAAVEPELAAE